MKYAAARLSLVPLRKSASDTAEMVSQLLFGEEVEVLSQHENWLYVRCLFDDYAGWLDAKQVIQLNENQMISQSSNYAIALELMQPAMNEVYSLPLLMGATLPHFDGLSFCLGEQSFTYSGAIIFANVQSQNPFLIQKICRKYLYTPYLWGGRSPFGIDCSGLSQIIYKFLNINLPRDASQQVKEGREVAFLEEAQIGDLAFFDNTKGKIIHVGIILSEQQIVHSSGYVRLSKLDRTGIWDEKQQTYTHRLRIIKRYLPDFSKEYLSDLKDTKEFFDTERENKNQLKFF